MLLLHHAASFRLSVDEAKGEGGALKPPSPNAGSFYDLLALQTIYIFILFFDRGTNSRTEDKGVPRKGT